MRKHYLFLALAWLGFCTGINAQITVTNSVFPVVGDTLFYIFGNQPGAINQIFTPPGGNQVWDLSNLQPSQVWNQIMKNPQTGTAAASFPGASVLFNPLNSSNQVYWQVTGTQINNMGYYGLDPIGLGLTLLFDNTPDLEVSWAPVNFFDLHQSASNVLTAFDAPIAPPVLLNLVPTADSFRIRVTYQRLGVIDAWGTLAIPGGSFDVLRKKQTEYRSTAVDVKVAPLGWIDISTIGGQQVLPLGTDTITTFHFLNDVSKEEIAICTLNTAQNEVVGVQYKLSISTGPPPLISSIDDDDADNIVQAGTMLTYTITFNEDINAATVTAADFDNAGTATISIGTIMETTPGVFTVQVTPTTAGTLILRIPVGAVIADVDGNNLVVPVLDETLTVLFSPIVGDADPADQAISDIIDQFLMETQNPPEIYDPCTCRNNTGIILNGTSTDDGLFDDEIIVISPTAGDTWEIADQMGSVFPFATNANPMAQPGDLTRVAPGTSLSYIGSVNTMNGIRYIYRLQIIHKDNEGYSVSVRETSNPFYADLILPISNRCFYPTPAINGLDPSYCVDASAVTLTGAIDRGDGQAAATPESAVFDIFNNANMVIVPNATMFDPASLGAGAFTVVYTVDAAAEGATIPGCVQAVSQMVSVGSSVSINPLMPQTICATRKIPLAALYQGVNAPDNAGLTYTWTIKEMVEDHGMLSGLMNDDPSAGTYMPGEAAINRGFVTLVLTVDNSCEPASTEVQIKILKVDCGAFPWNGNE
ncbi:MAG: hypothetical protein IPJ74_14520 [Saprospiraceae bacterium]|nr:hypothetical protein [Saprospiraceae bacterium]